MAAKFDLVKTKTPGVYKRGRSYVVRYRHHGQERKRYVRTYEEARALKQDLETDMRRGDYRERSTTTFEAYAREWVDSYQGRTTRGFRESTRVGYRRTIEGKAIPFFRKRAPLLAQLEPGDVRAFIGWLFDAKAQKRKLGVSTVRGHVAAVKVLLATAVEDGLIRHNPAAGVRISKPGAPIVEPDASELRRAMDSDELARFLGACPHEWEPFFRLLAMTGLRISEAVELRWKDVDFGTKRLRVRRQFYKGVVAPPKSESGSRDVPLSTAMARLLWPRLGEPDAHVFTGPRGERVSPDWLRKHVLKPTAKAADLPCVGFHTFRHTCASILFAEGRSPKQVQMWLGHSDPGFTLRVYVHLIDDGLGDADFLDEAKWAPPIAAKPAKPRALREVALAG